MKKEDVIHYYMGAEAEFDGRKGKITKVSIQNNNPLVRISWTSEYNRYIDAWASEIKLLLRPLSSMTEEEAIEYMELRNTLMGKIKVTSIVDGIINFAFTMNNGTIINGSDNLSSCNPIEFIYLISRGFDLWNLIPTQQAIDITKLNKDEQ